MKRIQVSLDGIAAAYQAVRREAAQRDVEKEARVIQIIASVREEGEAALLRLGRQFDCPTLDCIEMTADEWDDGIRRVGEDERQLLHSAASNIARFHEKQRRSSWMDFSEDVVLGQLLRPVERVGIYVPGGTAVYPSSVLMTAIPAKMAGVQSLIITTPAQRDGFIHPMVLAAARIAGVGRIFKIGGAQAIAALAYGVGGVPPVDMIVGPGNTYVNIAKRMLWGVVNMDMLAGPSEVCVLADETAKAEWVAADMITQVEHDSECAAYLVATSPGLADETVTQIEVQVADLPRGSIIKEALNRHGAVIIADTLEQAIQLANECAPEHLALMVKDPWSVIGAIRNAGAILVGNYTPQSVGDYWAGPSHTLPTGGAARYASPLNVDTFIKKTSVIAYEHSAIEQAGRSIAQLARIEGFEAHARAVEKRLLG
ncbi:MAG: histidinol dehydrogenase [Armatimonadetes bacterium]|nr:histidinol dehydrogenase [Armatimonadota bacterium]